MRNISFTGPSGPPGPRGPPGSKGSPGSKAPDLAGSPGGKGLQKGDKGDQGSAQEPIGAIAAGNVTLCTYDTKTSLGVLAGSSASADVLLPEPLVRKQSYTNI